MVNLPPTTDRKNRKNPSNKWIKEQKRSVKQRNIGPSC